MAFPKKILGIFPVGWQDRGHVGGTLVSENVMSYDACKKCRTKARVGIENNERFLFCKKCLQKLSEPKEE